MARDASRVLRPRGMRGIHHARSGWSMSQVRRRSRLRLSAIAEAMMKVWAWLARVKRSSLCGSAIFLGEGMGERGRLWGVFV